MINPIDVAESKSTVFAYPCQTRFRAVLIVLLVLVASVSSFASELFDKGAQALLYNQPREAATIFEQVIGQEPVNARAYLYLAYSYEQLQMYDRAISTLQRAETIPGVDKSAVKFNLGNNYHHLGDDEKALASYSAAIETNPTSVDAYLNRANLDVTLERYDDAVADYNRVLGLAPDHPQRPQIERMIALLQDHIEQARIAAEQEAQRKAEEQQREQEAEAARLAEEERQRQEAEARRRALLSNVLDSIKTSADDTENLSAGSETIDTSPDDTFDIAD